MSRRAYLADCETCGKRLYVGDRGYAYEDGPHFCAEDAPTLAEHIGEWEEQLKLVLQSALSSKSDDERACWQSDIDECREAIEAVDRKIANGAAWTDSAAYKL
jgi:hypothetical protein